MSNEIVYIFGAGRSGSTVLATVLNDHSQIRHVGELHHFFSYLKSNDLCSCGSEMKECIYWGKVVDKLPAELKKRSNDMEELCREMEYHSAIPFYLLGQNDGLEFEEYRKVQEQIIDAIRTDSTRYILDSAKYIGRFIGLRKIFNNRVKGIYLVRDLRGVIRSFKKKVQTQSPPLRTLVYYLFINFLGHLLYLLLPRDQVIKVRYEDIADNPQKTFSEIGEYLDLDLSGVITKIEEKEPFSIPHIVGGNRLKKKNSITLRKDDEWLKNMSVFQKVFYYLLAFPLMITNKYKMLK